jgi:hypothetical protein
MLAYGQECRMGERNTTKVIVKELGSWNLLTSILLKITNSLLGYDKHYEEEK